MRFKAHLFRLVWSLRAQVLALVLLGVIPAFGILIYQRADDRERHKDSARENVVQLARLTAAREERSEASTGLLFAGLARVPDILPSADPTACSAILADLRAQQPDYANLAAATPDGIVYCSAVPSSGAVNVSDRSYFTLAVETGRFAAGDFIIGRITGAPSVGFGYPILNEDGSVQAVLIASLDIGALGRLGAEAGLPEGAAMTIIDRTGTVLSSYPDNDLYAGRTFTETPLIKTVLATGQGTSDIEGIDGARRLYGFSPLGGADDPAGYVIVGVSEEAAFAAADRTFQRNLMALGGVAVIVVAAAWIFANWSTIGPVTAVVGASTRLRQGDLTARTGVSTRGELGQLARSFDEMASALQERERASKEAAQRLLQRETLLKIFVRHSPAAIAMFDREMNYVVASRRWSDDYALGDMELVGRNHYDVFPEIGDAWKEIHRRCLAGEVERREEDPFPRADGRVDWVRWEVRPWHDIDGEVGGIIMFTEVITERVAARARLQETADNLARINAELEAFTYSVSHDLKEPLRTVEAFSQFVLEDYGDRLDDEGRDYLQKLSNAAAHMKRLIEDLLALSRIGRRTDIANAVDVRLIVAQILEGFGATISEKKATVDVATDLPLVNGDAPRVEQIFGNLIANALKFSASEAPRITVGVRTVGDGTRAFYVQDNGIGIDPVYHERIFGIFQRLHRREEYEGTGAGLAIVKRAVEALDGRIWVESALGSGTTFLFVLPLAGDTGEMTEAA